VFKIDSISKERWIFISAKNSFYEPDAFIKFVKEYQSKLAGRIISISDQTQYSIENDPLRLVFQWDDCFGITVVVPAEVDIMAAEKALSYICDELNSQEKE